MDQQDSTFNVDASLIGKYLSGEASAEEAIQIENWISLSANNKLAFDQYFSTWNALQEGDEYMLPDKLSPWKRLQQTIGDTQKSAPVRRFLLRYRVAAIVAGVAFLSIIPILFVNRTGRDAPINQSFATTASVGQNILPDGSSVILNSNSVIRFPGKFESDIRQAELSGEAYFSIVPDAAKPFQVTFGEVNIQVLGTSFNVRRNPHRDVIETQVSSGRVKMFNQTGEIIIAAGQTGIYDETKNSFELQQALDVNSFSYATRNFVFADEELGNIINYLEKAYSKEIVLRNNHLSKCKMTSSFSNKSIEYILDVIATTLDIKYTVNGNTIYIEGGDHAAC